MKNNITIPHQAPEVTLLINILKNIDGETMQYLLKTVGMEQQMLRQLIMTSSDSDIQYLLEEKKSISKA